MGYYFHFSIFLGEKTFEINFRIPVLFNISGLLDVQANLPETSPFLSAQMALVSTFFQMFIVLGLGMYNFE
jgi:hypothetical protein